MRRSLLPLFMVAAGLLGPSADVRATESTDACTHMVDTPDYSVNEPGTYCLQGDVLETTEYGFVVYSPDVVIDCRGYAIGKLSNGSGYGVIATELATNLVVRNCDLRGFGYGILAYGGGLIEDNLIRNATYRGIYVDGDGSIVRRNRVHDTGAKSTFTVYAISAFGDVDIVDNLVDGVSVPDAPEAQVIAILANDGLVAGRKFIIRGNRVRRLQPVGTQQAYAIYTLSQGALVIRDNVLFGAGTTPNSIGIYCPYAPPSNISENDVFDFTYPTWACAGDAGNVTRP